jgi:hypothetical protein
MKISDAIEGAKYVVDPHGNKTEIVIPLETWKKLLASWKKLLGLLEDEEDRAIMKEWLENRSAGQAKSISLEELERELASDGLSR